MKRIIIAVSALLLFAAGCGGPRWQDAAVDAQDGYTIRIQHRVEDETAGMHQYKHPDKHPVDIAPHELAFFMNDLAYTSRSIIAESQESPVFQDKEVDRLAPALASALGELGPNERIALTSFNRGGGLVFEKRRKTEGVIFMDGKNRLNLAFAVINEEFPPGQTMSAAAKEPPGDPLSVRSSSTSLAITADYMQPHDREDGKAYPMWVKADVQGLKIAAKAAERPEDAPVDVPVTDREKRRDHIRSQLEYLKELHDDGLITETEYNEKRRELLERIE